MSNSPAFADDSHKDTQFMQEITLGKRFFKQREAGCFSRPEAPSNPSCPVAWYPGKPVESPCDVSVFGLRRATGRCAPG